MHGSRPGQVVYRASTRVGARIYRTAQVDPSLWMMRTLQPQPHALSVSGPEDQPEVSLQVDQRLGALFEGSAARICLTRFAGTQQPARAVPTKFAAELGEPEVPCPQCSQHPRHDCSTQPGPRAGIHRPAGNGPSHDSARRHHEDCADDPRQGSAALQRENDGGCALARGYFHRGDGLSERRTSAAAAATVSASTMLPEKLGFFVLHLARPRPPALCIRRV